MSLTFQRARSLMSFLLLALITTKATSKNACQKYILLTTQRSGSTWTCNLLDLQNGVTCGGLDVVGGVIRKPELLVQYSFLRKDRANVQWVDYEKDLSDAFHDASIANSCGDVEEGDDKEDKENDSDSMNSIAAGFKLMYDQIPTQFIESGQFVQYLVDHDVAVVHLIREAKILRISSLRLTQDEQSLLKGNPHTVDKELATKLHSSKLITWDETDIERIHLEEEIDEVWKRSLSFTPNLKYHQLSYEKMLLEEDLKDSLRQVLTFLFHNHFYDTNNWDNASSLTHSVKVNSLLLQMHETACSKRVTHYDDFEKSIVGTRTAAACKMLDQIFADGENEPM